jgi:uncharacterized protein (DUF1501 family)
MIMIGRRSLLASSLVSAALLGAPRISFARATGDKRFVFVIQRGAADGLHMIVPIGDPGLRIARAGLVDEIGPLFTLDVLFALHPALAQTAELYRKGDAFFVHAVATANRDRSHFDAQNILETGGRRPYEERSGWMNRMLVHLPGTKAMALAPAVPMALRGDRPVSSYAPSRLPGASADLMTRVSALYEKDQQLHPLWEQATQTLDLVDDLAANGGKGGQAVGELAARLLAPSDGARVMMIETGGWDTHSGQKARLNAQLGGLDRLIGAMKAGLGPEWANTVVVVATEFGRTVSANGTGGTDHGTASAAMVFGGGLKGGRVIADWPGLRPSDQLDGRDLKPTLSLESLIAGAVAEQFDLEPPMVLRTLFPGQAGLKPFEGLLRS